VGGIDGKWTRFTRNIVLTLFQDAGEEFIWHCCTLMIYWLHGWAFRMLCWRRR
jgi:hypothetical protein